MVARRLGSWRYAGALASAADVYAAALSSRREVAFAGRSNAGKSSLLNRLVGQKLARTSKTPVRSCACAFSVHRRRLTDDGCCACGRCAQGRTQMLHLFEHDKHLRLFDMPGYGFAKTAAATRDQWDSLMLAFFESRAEAACAAAAAGDNCALQTFVVVDCRRGLLDLDMHMLDMLSSFDLHRTVVLTKADKLKRKQLDSVVHNTAMMLASYGHLEIHAADIHAAENGAKSHLHGSSRSGNDSAGEYHRGGGGLILTSAKSGLGVEQLRAHVLQ